MPDGGFLEALVADVFVGGEAASFAAGASMVGLAVTGVGMLAGDKDLMKIGGMISMIGGATSLISGVANGLTQTAGQMIASQDAAMAEPGFWSDTATTTGVTNDATAAIQDGGAVTTPLASTPPIDAQPLGDSNGFPAPTDAPLASGDGQATNPGGAQQDAAGNAQTPDAAQPVSAPSAAVAPEAPTGDGSLTQKQMIDAQDAGLNTNDPGVISSIKQAAAKSGDPGFMDKLGTWLTQKDAQGRLVNKDLINMGASALSSAMKYISPDPSQKAALMNAQTTRDVFNANQAKYNAPGVQIYANNAPAPFKGILSR